MRKTFTALTIFAALVPATGAAAAAKPAPLKTTSIPAAGRVLGAADATTLAVRGAGGAVTLLGDTAAARTVPARGGCTADAVGSGQIAWDCGDTPAPAGVTGPAVRSSAQAGDDHLRTIVVTDLAGTEQGRVAVPFSFNLDAASAVGTTWVEDDQAPADAHGATTRIWTNWHTGEQRTVDEHDATTFQDLDSPGLVASYCAGVRAQAVTIDPDAGSNQPLPLRDVQYRSPYALVDTRDAADHPVHHVLQRCGASRPVAAPAAPTRTTGSIALGAGGLVAWWSPVKGKAGSLQLFRARDRRVWTTTVRYKSTSYAPLVLTRGSAWLRTSDTRIARVALPR